MWLCFLQCDVYCNIPILWESSDFKFFFEGTMMGTHCQPRINPMYLIMFLTIILIKQWKWELELIISWYASQQCSCNFVLNYTILIIWYIGFRTFLDVYCWICESLLFVLPFQKWLFIIKTDLLIWQSFPNRISLPIFFSNDFKLPCIQWNPFAHQIYALNLKISAIGFLMHWWTNIGESYALQSPPTWGELPWPWFNIQE